jgi:hypothetical protein
VITPLIENRMSPGYQRFIQSGEHYAKFGVLLEFGTEVRMINSIDIRSLLIYTELL